ncbi:MAG: hypothetical protein ACSLFD_06835 [Solirubrobacterales bacterium]
MTTRDSRMKRVLLLTSASVVSAALLFGCSGDDDSANTSASTTGNGSVVTGSARCDQASMQKAVESWAKANGSGKATLPETPKGYSCADGWAVAFPNVGSGEAEVTVTAVFEAEGQFWIPKDRTEVCGKNASRSEVPSSLYKSACQTN